MANKMLAVPCTLFWTNPNRPDKYGNISGTFGRLAPESVKSLKEAGLKPKFDADNEEGDENHQGFYLKARSDTPVTAYDSAGKVLPSTLLLGNGTKAVAIIEARDWVSSERGTSGTKAIFRGLKVMELVEYNPDAAAQAKAEAMLDGVSGGGFVFGEGGADADDATDDDQSSEELDRLFNEASA